MDSTVLSSLIAAVAGLLGTFIGSKISLLSQKNTSQMQSDLTEKQIKNSFQLAAMEKRLEAHQKAYDIWTRMASYVHAPYEVKDKVRDDAVEFFATHCLYLEPKTADEFRKCINNYYDYKTQLDFFNLMDRNSPDAKNAVKNLKKMWNQIQETDRYIMEGAKYPFINIELTKEDPMGEKKEENKHSR